MYPETIYLGFKSVANNTFKLINPSGIVSAGTARDGYWYHRLVLRNGVHVKYTRSSFVRFGDYSYIGFHGINELKQYLSQKEMNDLAKLGGCG